MPEYVIADKKDLTSIADAVRAITGSTGTMKIYEMGYNISTIFNDSTITRADIPYGEHSYDKNGKAEGTALLKRVSGTGVQGFPNVRKWHSMAYGNGKFVCIVNGSNKAAYSYDGIIWTETTLPQSKGWTGLCYGNGIFFAIANDTTDYVYSYDGINWNGGTLPARPYWNMSAYGAGKFVAVGYNNSSFCTSLFYSVDGTNWIEVSTPIDNSNIRAVTYGAGKFVAVNYNSNKVIYCDFNNFGMA